MKLQLEKDTKERAVRALSDSIEQFRSRFDVSSSEGSEATFPREVVEILENALSDAMDVPTTRFEERTARRLAEWDAFVDDANRRSDSYLEILAKSIIETEGEALERFHHSDRFASFVNRLRNILLSLSTQLSKRRTRLTARPGAVLTLRWSKNASVPNATAAWSSDTSNGDEFAVRPIVEEVVRKYGAFNETERAAVVGRVMIRLSQFPPKIDIAGLRFDPSRSNVATHVWTKVDARAKFIHSETDSAETASGELPHVLSSEALSWEAAVAEQFPDFYACLWEWSAFFLADAVPTLAETEAIRLVSRLAEIDTKAQLARLLADLLVNQLGCSKSCTERITKIILPTLPPPKAEVADDPHSLYAETCIAPSYRWTMRLVTNQVGTKFTVQSADSSLDKCRILLVATAHDGQPSTTHWADFVRTKTHDAALAGLDGQVGTKMSEPTRCIADFPNMDRQVVEAIKQGRVRAMVFPPIENQTPGGPVKSDDSAV